MKVTYTRKEFLNIMCFNNIFTKEEYNERIELYKNNNVFPISVEENYPTYEEYLEYYIKDGFDFYEMFTKQTKKIAEFQIWLLENKEKTFSYDEIEQKLLDLELAFNGFNGGPNIGGDE